MTVLTLNQCNNVISKLRKLLVVPSLVKMNMTDLMLYDTYIDLVLKKVSNQRDLIQLQEDLYATIYGLKSKIICANCENGINECISSISRLTDVKKFYSDFRVKQNYGLESNIDASLLENLRLNYTDIGKDMVNLTSRTVLLLSDDDLNAKNTDIIKSISLLEQERDVLNNSVSIEYVFPSNIAILLGL
jgi:hypothetical protein